MAEIKPSEVTAILRKELQQCNTDAQMEETGTTLVVGDGIARVYGLQNVRSGALVEFEKPEGNVTGIVLNLDRPLCLKCFFQSIYNIYRAVLATRTSNGNRNIMAMPCCKCR